MKQLITLLLQRTSQSSRLKRPLAKMDNQLGVAREKFSIMDREKLLITGSGGRILMGKLGNSFDLCGLDIVPAPKNVNARVADITDPDAMDTVFQAFSPVKYVVHLAADPRPDKEKSCVQLIASAHKFESSVYDRLPFPPLTIRFFS
ncbi:hypothetical protein ACFL03_05370 [Thermodesulfobacteriota bacterium]